MKSFSWKMHTGLGGQMSPQGAFSCYLANSRSQCHITMPIQCLFSARKRIKVDVTQWQHGTTLIVKHFVLSPRFN